MSKVVPLNEYRPHICLQTQDGQVHILPVSTLEDFIRGRIGINDIDDGEQIVRVLLDDYMSLLR